MPHSWRTLLHADPIPWLLEPENPAVRYLTLRNLLDRAANDPDVLAAQAAIPDYAPVAELLARQRPDGSWVKRDYYLPKHSGTFWVLCVLGDMGLTAEHPQIRTSCEFMFTFQRQQGPFCRRRRVSGRGTVWDTDPGPCTHARIVRFLIQFGYGDDPRVRAGIDWLLAAQRPDGLWDCGRPTRPGCLRATHDVLRVAALDPEAAAHPAVAGGAAVVCDMLMERSMSRYHVGIAWTTLQWPPFDYSLVGTLDSLARLDYTLDHPKIAQAVDYLLSRQSAGGSWPLDETSDRPPFDPGPTGLPNKWVTLEALQALRLLLDKPQVKQSPEQVNP
ncbi:MAG: prenyltransferase/squalene oxidase repeat-containing protein [Anaerolineae bacterium]|jgi:hypothetical protein